MTLCQFVTRTGALAELQTKPVPVDSDCAPKNISIRRDCTEGSAMVGIAA